MESIRQILIRRDGLTDTEARNRIDETRRVLYEYLESGDMESAERVCQDELGLEPDYLMELI